MKIYLLAKHEKEMQKLTNAIRVGARLRLATVKTRTNPYLKVPLSKFMRQFSICSFIFLHEQILTGAPFCLFFSKNSSTISSSNDSVAINSLVNRANLSLFFQSPEILNALIFHVLGCDRSLGVQDQNNVVKNSSVSDLIQSLFNIIQMQHLATTSTDLTNPCHQTVSAESKTEKADDRNVDQETSGHELFHVNEDLDHLKLAETYSLKLQEIYQEYVSCRPSSTSSNDANAFSDHKCVTSYDANMLPFVKRQKCGKMLEMQTSHFTSKRQSSNNEHVEPSVGGTQNTLHQTHLAELKKNFTNVLKDWEQVDETAASDKNAELQSLVKVDHEQSCESDADHSSYSCRPSGDKLMYLAAIAALSTEDEFAVDTKATTTMMKSKKGQKRKDKAIFTTVTTGCSSEPFRTVSSSNDSSESSCMSTEENQDNSYRIRESHQGPFRKRRRWRQVPVPVVSPR